MLVLSRKPGERICIGDDVWVEVRRVTGNRVTLAIAAPKDVHILRAELEPFAREFDRELGTEAPSEVKAEPYRVEHYRIQGERSRRSSRQPVIV